MQAPKGHFYVDRGRLFAKMQAARDALEQMPYAARQNVFPAVLLHMVPPADPIDLSSYGGALFYGRRNAVPNGVFFIRNSVWDSGEIAS